MFRFPSQYCEHLFFFSWYQDIWPFRNLLNGRLAFSSFRLSWNPFANMSYWLLMHSKWNLFSFVFALFGWWLVCSVDAGESPFQQISWQLFDRYGKLKSWTCIKWKAIDYVVREDVYYIIKLILHFREALQAKTFYLWWRKYQLIMDIRMMERMVRVFNLYFC